MKYQRDLLKEFKKANTVAIFIHRGPDGDAIGSSSAIFYYLTSLGKQVDIYSSPTPAANFDWLESFDAYRSGAIEGKAYDLGVVLDCGEVKLITDDDMPAYKNCKRVVVIDHHLGNNIEADVKFVDSSSCATCELVTELFQKNKIKFPVWVANALYFGLMTDTACFQNTNTTDRSIKTALYLIKNGAENVKIAQQAMRSKPLILLSALKYFYDNVTLCCDNQVAYSYIDYKTITKLGVKKGDMPGLSNSLIEYDGVKIGFVIYEMEPNKLEGSMRSKQGYAVNSIASHFGGGGHLGAAGFNTTGNLKDVINEILPYCEKEINK